jgi:hypothetical protein
MTDASQVTEMRLVVTTDGGHVTILEAGRATSRQGRVVPSSAAG